MKTKGVQQGKTRWAHYSIAYHFVWIPKYRRPVLLDDVQAAFNELVAECCERHGFTLLECETDQDHVHVFVSAPPSWAPATIVGYLKGYTSRFLRLRFNRLVKICRKDPLWTKAYYVGTAGATTSEAIRKYIAESQGR